MKDKKVLFVRSLEESRDRMMGRMLEHYGISYDDYERMVNRVDSIIEDESKKASDEIGELIYRTTRKEVKENSNGLSKEDIERISCELFPRGAMFIVAPNQTIFEEGLSKGVIGGFAVPDDNRPRKPRRLKMKEVELNGTRVLLPEFLLEPNVDAYKSSISKKYTRFYTPHTAGMIRAMGQKMTETCSKIHGSDNEAKEDPMVNLVRVITISGGAKFYVDHTVAIEDIEGFLNDIEADIRLQVYPEVDAIRGQDYTITVPEDLISMIDSDNSVLKYPPFKEYNVDAPFTIYYDSSDEIMQTTTEIMDAMSGGFVPDVRMHMYEDNDGKSRPVTKTMYRAKVEKKFAEHVRDIREQLTSIGYSEKKVRNIMKDIIDSNKDK